MDLSSKRARVWCTVMYTRFHTIYYYMYMICAKGKIFILVGELSSSDTQPDMDTHKRNRKSSTSPKEPIKSLDMANNQIGDISALITVAETCPESIEQLTCLQFSNNLVREFPRLLPQVWNIHIIIIFENLENLWFEFERYDWMDCIFVFV